MIANFGWLPISYGGCVFFSDSLGDHGDGVGGGAMRKYACLYLASC